MANTITSKRISLGLIFAACMASCSMQAVPFFGSRLTTPSPTPTANQNLFGSVQLQAERAQQLMYSKQLVLGSISDEVARRIAVQIDVLARNVNALDINRYDFPIAVKQELERLYTLLSNLTTETEKETNTALLPIMAGSDATIIHGKNSEILSFLELHRPDQHSLLRRLMLNKYTLVGLPVVCGTMGWLYRSDLAPVYGAMQQGYVALRSGSVNATEVTKKLIEACKQLPALRSTKQLTDAAHKVYSVARNERQRKTIALGVLSTMSVALMLDTYRHKPSHSQEARTRGTYAPSRLLYFLNNSLRFSSNHDWRFKMILGLPLGVVGTQAALGLAQKTENGSWNTSHLPALLSMRENWLYKLCTLASANIATQPDRVGFKLYAKVLPFFAGNPTKVAIFTILTAGLASHSLKALHSDCSDDELPWYDKVYYGVNASGEVVGAVALAALLTNWLTQRPMAKNLAA